MVIDDVVEPVEQFLVSLLESLSSRVTLSPPLTTVSILETSSETHSLTHSLSLSLSLSLTHTRNRDRFYTASPLTLSHSLSHSLTHSHTPGIEIGFTQPAHTVGEEESSVTLCVNITSGSTDVDIEIELIIEYGSVVYNGRNMHIASHSTHVVLQHA